MNLRITVLKLWTVDRNLEYVFCFLLTKPLFYKALWETGGSITLVLKSFQEAEY